VDELLSLKQVIDQEIAEMEKLVDEESQHVYRHTVEQLRNYHNIVDEARDTLSSFKHG
jgi:hypothetical protein